MRVLVIDDMEADRRIIAHRLERLIDGQVSTAPDLVSALPMIAQADVVFSDLGLGDSEPDDTIDALANTGHAHVVIFSDDPRLRAKGEAAGMQVVSKDDDDAVWQRALPR